MSMATGEYVSVSRTHTPALNWASFWSALAMAVTFGIGRVLGIAVG